MNILKRWLSSWIFWLALVVLCVILMFIDIHYDLSDFGTLSLVSLVAGLIFFIVFLVVWGNGNNGIKRILTIVISFASVGIILLLLSALDIFYYSDFDLEFILPITRILFFLSGTVLLLKLVWRKK